MRIYEVQGNGIHRFVRTFEEARAVIREQNPAAKKIKGSELPEMMFEDGWTVGSIDMDTTKAGIIGELNRALNKGKHCVDPSPVVEEPESDVDEYYEKYLELKNQTDSKSLHSISPPISYPGLPKNCKGKCLHCDKEVGWLLHTGK